MATPNYVFEERLETGRSVRWTEAGPESTRSFHVTWDIEGTQIKIDPESAAIQFQAMFHIGSQHPVFTDPQLFLVEINTEQLQNLGLLFARYLPRVNSVGENSHGETWRLELATQEELITSVALAADVTHYPNTDINQIGQAINVDQNGNVLGAQVLRPSQTVSVVKFIVNVQIKRRKGTQVVPVNYVVLVPEFNRQRSFGFLNIGFVCESDSDGGVGVGYCSLGGVRLRLDE